MCMYVYIYIDVTYRSLSYDERQQKFLDMLESILLSYMIQNSGVVPRIIV